MPGEDSDDLLDNIKGGALRAAPTAGRSARQLAPLPEMGPLTDTAGPA